MEEKLFAELMESAQQALEHAQGKRELRTTVLPAPPEPMPKEAIRELRDRFALSQAVFAHLINVSPKTVQAWESGVREPDAAALKLLRVAERAPGAVFGDIVLLTKQGSMAVAEAKHFYKPATFRSAGARARVAKTTRRKGAIKAVLAKSKRRKRA